MSQRPAPLGEALDLLTGQIGEPTQVRLVSDRRGSRTWKIEGPLGAVALEANSPWATTPATRPLRRPRRTATSCFSPRRAR